MAQKHILKNNADLWEFRFTTNEPVLSEYKLLLIPKYMGDPQMYELSHLNDEKEEVMAIQCSEWPMMHVRLGKLQDEIKIILHGIRYFI